MLKNQTIQQLEPRRLLASAVAAMGPVFPTSINTAPPAIQLLADLKKLSSKTAKALVAAHADLFAPVSAIGKSTNGATTISQTSTSATAFTFDFASLKSQLAQAPLEFTAAAKSSPLVLALPMPDGSFARFAIVSSPIMEAPLAKKYPSIKTFDGQGIDDPTATVRLDYTPLGFHAQVLSPNGAYYIDPYYLNDSVGTYTSFYMSDATTAGSYNFDLGEDVSAETDVTQLATPAATPAETPTTFGTTLKTYRAAVAADGEYTAAVGGGTVAGGLSAVVTAMNRVVGVYQTELDISMTLVANENLLIYTNASTDPYTNSGSDLNTNTATCNSVIGVNNYDIGHVFTTGSGGVAQLGCVGKSNKGAGTTGKGDPQGDAFTIDYVAHEMGHQFGANHTFNTANDTGNRSASHAYEPGSGSTIMAYAGIEGSEDLQAHSDPYFHSDSIDAIRTYITSSIPSVGTSTSTGNNAPTVSAGLNYTIPINTPFTLTASGSDPDSDALTFEWQERDLGAATLLSDADNGASPLFRDWVPSTSPSRTLPQLSGILDGSDAINNASGLPVEKLFAKARTSHWRVIARDNRAGGGGVSTADMTLTVANSTAPFAVTTLNNSGNVLSGGSMQTITWSVGSTNVAPISTSAVNILLSSDGGNTFPITLAAATANDGSETVQIPSNIASTTARIEIVPVGNIYFDINDSDFTITHAQSATTGQPALEAASDTGLSSSDDITNKNNSASSKLIFDVPGTILNATVNLYADGTLIGTGVGNGGTVSITTDGVHALSDGPHNFTSRQIDGALSESADSTITQITIDTIGPALASAPVVSLAPTKTVSFTFGEDVSASLNALGIDGANLFNNTSSSTVSANGYSYDSPSKTATYTYGSLSDGYYSALSAATDAAGNAVTGAATNFIYVKSDGDSIYLQRGMSPSTDVEVYKNATPSGPSFTAPFANLSFVFVDGSANDDEVTIDYINGSPIPAGPSAFRFVGGAGEDSLNLVNPGNFVFANDPVADCQNLTVNVSAGASVEFDASRSHLAALNLDGGNALIPANLNALLVTGALSIVNNATLDLTNNDMIVDYGFLEISPLHTIEGYISSARANGLWNGSGLTSSSALSLPRITTIGAMEASDYKNLSALNTSFDGEEIDNSAVLIKFTYYGDTNFNGKVDGGDYARMDLTFAHEISQGNIGGWINGDFNDDGRVNGSDYALADLAFGGQTATL